MARVILYARQSIEKEEGDKSLSIESQISALTERCKQEGWRIVGTIREAGLRGWKDADERPGMQEAISAAKNGNCDTLLVWDLSRLARSVRLQEQWVWEFSSYGTDIISHTEPESADALIRQIKGAVNEYRTREISAHTRRALRERAQRGLHHGRLPWGHVSAGDGKLTPDPDIAPIVRELYELRAAGVGPAELARILTRRGIRPALGGAWSPAQIGRILSHVAHRGAVTSGEQVIEGCHPAIVSAELWHAANGTRERHRSPREKTVRSWLEGHIWHLCGAPMYLNGPTPTKDYAQFRCRFATANQVAIGQLGCPHSPRALRQPRAEAMVWERVIDDLACAQDPAWVLATAAHEYDRLAPAWINARSEALARQQAIGEQRERRLQSYWDGHIDRARLDVEMAKLAAEDADIARRLATLPSPPDPTEIAATWELLTDLRAAAEHVVDEDRGPILRALGAAIVAPAGHRHPRGGSADAGRVEIRHHAALEWFFRKTP